MPKKIVLIHRAADELIANALKRNLEDWGGDDMIFQVPLSGSGGGAQDGLTSEHREALAEASLVLLIYTVPDSDWAVCTLACGLAIDLKNLATRTVLFHCSSEDSPWVPDGLRFRVEKADIKSFTARFHSEPHFLPGDAAFWPGITEEMLERRSERLFKELDDAVSKGKSEERYRWDFLRLSMLPSDASEISELERSEAVQPIMEKSRVEFAFGDALRHFGFLGLDRNLRLIDLVGRWKQRTQGRKGVEDDWVAALAAEMHRAIDNSPANYEWSKLNSVDFPVFWYYPVVNHVRILPGRGMEFDVYLYRLFRDNPAAA